MVGVNSYLSTHSFVEKFKLIQLYLAKIGYLYHKRYILEPNGSCSRGLYIVGSQGASQLGGSLLGIPLGYKAN